MMSEINEHQKVWAITQEELNLRFDYMNGKITLDEFNKRFKRLKKQGKVVRDGRVMK